MRDLSAYAVYSPFVLRLGFAIVFVWFGSQQMANPDAWTGFLPEFMNGLPIAPETFVQVNGWTEIVGAFLLVTGFWLRPVAALLALHMFGIAFTAGGAIGMRDFGLGMALVSLALAKPDPCSLDAQFDKQEGT